MPRQETMDSLRRAAEEASSAMRRAAFELEEIARLTPGRAGGKARRQQLEHTASRLSSAADLLTAEVAAASPKTAGWVAQIGRRALVVGAAVALAATTGLGEAAGQAALQNYTSQHQAAERCLAVVEQEAAAASIALLEQVNDDLTKIATSLREIAGREPQIRNHPAFHGARSDPELIDPSVDRERRLGLLIDAAMKLRGFMGPLHDYEDDPELLVAMERLAADIDAQGQALNQLRGVLGGLE